MARGALPVALDDVSPLNGASVDVAARIGWTLRMARLVQPDGAVPTLERLASDIGTSAARLHRLETGRLRDGLLIGEYERALGRPPGSLRAPVDIMCRTFRDAPADRRGESILTTVAEVSRLTDRVGSSAATGGEWLEWARALSSPGALGMPEELGATLITKLVSELGRSAGHAHPTRYEALALLRTGGYGHLVVLVAREFVADRHVQILYDLMSGVGERVTDDAFAWCTGLLDDTRDRVMVGAVLGLECMGQVGGDAVFWSALLEQVIPRFDRSEPGSTQEWWLSHVLRLVPGAVWRTTTARPRRPLTPPAAIADWSRSRLNLHWNLCETRARGITKRLGLTDQPMLTRFFFDIVMSPLESRSVTSSTLVSAVPVLAAELAKEVADIAAEHRDPVIRARAGRRLAGFQHTLLPDVATGWLAGGDRELRDHALMLAGASGTAVDASVLVRALDDGPDSRRAAMYAVGMADHPLLAEITQGPRERWSPDVRGAAHWWSRQGSRVSV